MLRISPLVRRMAALGLAGGLLAAGQLPAAAAAASQNAARITISARNPALKKVTGYVWVIYRNPVAGQADVSGRLAGVSAGEVVRLYGQPFHARRPVLLGSETISSGGPAATFSFRVSPALATRYQAKLFANSTATRSLATSAITTVYVSDGGKVTGGRKCKRPVCHETFRLYSLVPASALKAEMRKRTYVYFGINLSATGTPNPPKRLALGAGHGKAARARRLSASEYEVTISYSFRVGNDGFYWTPSWCAKDNERQDGLGLPGHHGCGARTISATAYYLG